MPLPPPLHQLLTGLFFVFGSLLGSFCNVVILRMAEGRSVVFPPSACPHCHHQLSPLDLIPIFGWIFLRGRCRYCAAPISVQYPLVESAIAVILAAAFFTQGPGPRLVPTAAWGVIWAVNAILAVRGEVTAPAPFLWGSLYWVGLSLWAGGLRLPETLLALLTAALGTAILGWKSGDGRFYARFGPLAGGFLPFWGRFPAFLGLGLAVLGLLRFWGSQGRWRGWMAKGLLLAWVGTGIALGVMWGYWI